MADRVESQMTVVELLGPNRDGELRDITVAAGTTISKGIGLTLTSPRTGIKTSTLTQKLCAPVAGISAMEKDGSDPSTTISVITQGIIEGSASGAITIGRGVGLTESNHFIQVGPGTDGASGAILCGTAVKTVAATATGPKVQVRINL